MHSEKKMIKKKNTNVEMILTTDAQLRTFDVNEQKNYLRFFFRGNCHTTNRDCEHRKSRTVLVIFEHASLDILYLF